MASKKSKSSKTVSKPAKKHMHWDDPVPGVYGLAMLFCVAAAIFLLVYKLTN